MKQPSQLAIKTAASAWTQPETENIEMDTILGRAFAIIIDDIWSKPWLGNATTEQLIDELRARCEVNGTINYKTTE